MEYAIEVSGLSKAYGGRRAVDGLSFCVPRGTVFGLLGANGAGKSTTIDCMLGTKRMDAGRVRILGMDPVRERRALFERVGVQFQEGDYPKDILVGELCEETACLYRRAKDWRALLEQFGSGGREKQRVQSLSGGERQRLFIVLALIPGPQAVILDELTTGLDARARRDVWSRLGALKAQGMTLLLTSHFMDEVEALCDGICILKRGVPVFRGTVEEAKARCGCARFEDAYLMLSDEREGRG